MLEPVTYEFPSEPEVFVRLNYAARVEAVDASIAAEHRKITVQGIALGAACFLSLLSLGFVGAAVVDQGRANIKQWVASHEPV